MSSTYLGRITSRSDVKKDIKILGLIIEIFVLKLLTLVAYMRFVTLMINIALWDL